MPSRMDAYIAQAGALAQRMGISNMILAVQDPDTGEAKVVASPTGVAILKDPVLKKLGIDGGELGGADEEAVWPSAF